MELPKAMDLTLSSTFVDESCDGTEVAHYLRISLPDRTMYLSTLNVELPKWNTISNEQVSRPYNQIALLIFISPLVVLVTIVFAFHRGVQVL